MCQLQFSYLAQNVPQKMKNQFEARINKQYESVCDEMNKKDTVINVSWKVPGIELRGVFAADLDLLDKLKRNNLGCEF